MTVVTYARSLLTLSYFGYVSPISQEHTYSLCVKNLLQCDVIIRAKYLRVLFCELTRILNNLLNVSSQAVDVAITPLLWLFEEREKTLEFWLHAAYIRPGGVAAEAPDFAHLKVLDFMAK